MENYILPCLTPCLLTTHDIYSISEDGFCSVFQAHGTLSPASTELTWGRPTQPSCCSSWDSTDHVQPGSSCHHLQPFLAGCCCLSAFQQLWQRLVTAPGKAVPAPCPELGITSATLLRLQAADREAFPWLTPSITQHDSVKTPGQQQLFPGRHGRQQFHMLSYAVPVKGIFPRPSLHLQRL